jgi:hypothetical protein
MKHFTVIHVSSLLTTATPGPLLRLVWLQDRGVCKFVGLKKTWLIFNSKKSLSTTGY